MTAEENSEAPDGPAKKDRTFATYETLTPGQVDAGFKWATHQGVSVQLMETLTVGAFLTAYALSLGASNAMIGFLAAIPALAQLMQLPGVYLVERFQNRKMVSFIGGMIARPMLIVMAAAAFIAGTAEAMVLLMVAFAVRYGAGAFIASSWNPWMRDLIPEPRMGEFYGRRLLLMTGFGAVASLIAAALIDTWVSYDVAPVQYVYALLLVIASVAGFYSVYAALRVPEPTMHKPDADLSLGQRLIVPFRDTNYRKLLGFLGTWNFAINLAAPFFIVHMLQRLGLSMSVVIGLTILSQAANMLVVRQWGAIADRVGDKAVLRVCGPLFVICIFAWIFTARPESDVLTIGLLAVIHIFTGVATAGVTLASGNIALRLAPRGQATAFLAANSVVVALASGIAPILGGLFVDFFMTSELSLTLHWRDPNTVQDFDTISVTQWDFFFLLATLFGVISLQRLGYVRDVKEPSGERVSLAGVLMTAGRSVRALSSIAGLRAASDFPFELLRQAMRRNGKGEEEGEEEEDVKRAVQEGAD